MAAALAELDGGYGTPLHRAARCKQPEGAAADGVRLLLAAGADAATLRRLVVGLRFDLDPKRMSTRDVVHSV